MYDTSSRRQFLAVGGRRHAVAPPGEVSYIGGAGSTWPEWMEGTRHQDVIPDVVRVLHAAAGGVATASLLESGVVGEAELQQLLDAGVLAPGAAPQDRVSSWLRSYQRAVFDYPFHDYFDEDWRAKDKALMAEYRAAWEPPAPLTPRPGVQHPLPPSDPTTLERAGREPALTLGALATILKLTLGPRELVDEPVSGLLQRRTSPSGGSRHPTELVLLLGRELDGLPAGAYFYDAEAHALVGAPAHRARALQLGSFGFLVTSRVARAMWRYRETRSFRPVSIDAGHITETLGLLLGRRGLAIDVRGGGPVDVGDPLALEEPVLALVTVDGPPPPPATPTLPALDGSALVTNPGLFVGTGPAGLRAEILWPERGSIDLDLAEFQVLGHCFPSRRGDRDTTPEGITAAITEVGLERIGELAAAGALLPARLAAPLSAGAQLWGRHGWYLSFLAHLEITSTQVGELPAAPARVAELPRADAASLVSTLMARRTTRAFAPKPVPEASLDELLRASLGPLDAELAPLGARWQTIVGTLNAEGHPSEAHRWDATEERLVPLGVPLTPLQVREMTIGQEPISAAGAVLWLAVTPDFERTDAYELALLAMGRAGQRICLLATELGLGVFMTPAVNDVDTYDTLGLADAPSSVTYAFGIGVRHGGSDAR